MPAYAATGVVDLEVSAAAAVHDTLVGLARRYPSELVAQEIADVPRIAFHIGLVRSHGAHGGTVCDLGGGVGLFSVGCAALGMRTMLVDDFADPVAGHAPQQLLDLHRAHGVRVVQQDLTEGLDVPPISLAAVTCFHSIEHWHRSPRRLFADVMTALAPGGAFVLAAPNAVNLRKRVSVLLGYSNWSPLSEWYDADRFRGHVREPTMADLHAIATRMGLVRVSVFGRNWLGRTNHRPSVRVVSRLTDRLLRIAPALCSDLYLVGEKRGPEPSSPPS